MFFRVNLLVAVFILIIAGVAAPLNLIFPSGSGDLPPGVSFTNTLTKQSAFAFLPESSDIVRRIEINLTTQRMKLFVDEKEVADFVTSSGKRATPTKAGQFSILAKYPVAYGVIDGIVWKMPYFMTIYVVAGQENGIHELPFANARRESVRDMGRPVSHGCVRLSIGEAEKVYNFAKIGTPVWIHY